MPIKGTYYNATLGAAPTSNTQLGFVNTITTSFITNTTASTTNSPLNYGTFIISTPGVWIVNYMMYGGSSSNPQATVLVYSNAIGFPSNIGTSTAPFAETALAPVAGLSGTNAVVASGSFVTTITTSVTFDVYINIFVGTIATFRGWSYVQATRIG